MIIESSRPQEANGLTSDGGVLDKIKAGEYDYSDRFLVVGRYWKYKVW